MRVGPGRDKLTEINAINFENIVRAKLGYPKRTENSGPNIPEMYFDGKYERIQQSGWFQKNILKPSIHKNIEIRRQRGLDRHMTYPIRKKSTTKKND